MDKMTPKTAQQIFDHVTVHLLTQMKQSMTHVNRTAMGGSDDGSKTIPILTCAYRGDDGTKCAVGSLIPDELYSRSLEGMCISSADVRTVLARVGIVHHDQLWLVGMLQTVHDSWAPERWRDELRIVALRTRLTFNPPAEAQAS
jgi:hypothetical protein